MRRVVEVTLVLAALVVLPVVVLLLARSEASANAGPSALAAARRILGTTPIDGMRLRLSGCTWSPDRSRISCRATGPGSGTCTFTAGGGGSCEGSSGDSFWTLQFASPRR